MICNTVCLWILLSGVIHSKYEQDVDRSIILLTLLKYEISKILSNSQFGAIALFILYMLYTYP